MQIDEDEEQVSEFLKNVPGGNISDDESDISCNSYVLNVLAGGARGSKTPVYKRNSAYVPNIMQFGIGQGNNNNGHKDGLESLEYSVIE